MVERIASTDPGYTPGDLSIFPEGIDTKDTMYEATNNSEAFLTHSLTFTSKYIAVNDTSSFPEKGILKINQESIYYDSKTSNTFQDLIRGFLNTANSIHNIGSTISLTVDAEHHNAIKDAIINIEDFVGLIDNPDPESLNGQLEEQEKRWLSPKPKFRAYPREGPPPLQVAFQNFSSGEAVKFLWDFGDGGTSTDITPIHTYVGEGSYTVRLTIFTSLNAEGISIKSDYIRVDANLQPPFMYVTPEMGTTATTFNFVDQTDGDIVSRSWIFDDGEEITIDDPDIHSVDHVYTTPGEYNPVLIISFADTTTRFVQLNDPIIVT